jgi:hypothetical protein
MKSQKNRAASGARQRRGGYSFLPILFLWLRGVLHAGHEDSAQPVVINGEP